MAQRRYTVNYVNKSSGSRIYISVNNRTEEMTNTSLSYIYDKNSDLVFTVIPVPEDAQEVDYFKCQFLDAENNLVYESISEEGDSFGLPNNLLTSLEQSDGYDISSVVITVYFKTKTININVYSNNYSQGTVSISGSGTYNYGDTYTITASPTSNAYIFAYWKDDKGYTYNSTPATFKATENKNFTAYWSNNTYTVSYYANGGNSTPSSQTANVGTSIILAPAISRNNSNENGYTVTFNANGGSVNSTSITATNIRKYIFDNWQINGTGTTYEAEATYSDNASVTLYAMWISYILSQGSVTTPTATRDDIILTRNVIFDGNGGTLYNSSATSESITNYYCTGWWTSGGTQRTTNGGSYTPTQPETLYAQWDSSTSEYSQITFPSGSRTGYTLIGFGDSKSSTKILYEPGDKIIPTKSSQTYYAIWKKTITLTYHANGGSGILPDDQSATIYNATPSASFTVDLNSQVNLSRTGYKFLGWSTYSDATAKSYSQGDIINISDNTTLYAVWEIQKYTITASTYLRDSAGGTDKEDSSCGSIVDENENPFTSGTFNYGTVIELLAKPAEDYSFKGWENNSALSRRIVTVPAYDLEIKAYFTKKNYSLTSYNQTPNSDIHLWIREKNSNETYNDWMEIPFDQAYGFGSKTTIQIMVEDGEDYEFTNATIPQNVAIGGITGYPDYTISDSTTLTISSQPIPTSNKIFVGGKTNGLKTSGYIKDPNISFEEPIKSIWIGNQQIMGKTPTREYPYEIDTLLGDTLYIGKNKITISDDYVSNSNIKKVIMPDSVKVIENNAFEGCSNLETIYFSKNLESIGPYAFLNTSLKKIYLPDTITSIGSGAFSHDTFETSNLEKIVLPSLLNTINSNLFWGSKIKSITLPDNVISINSQAFTDCYNLTQIFIPESLTSIEYGAFFNCRKLKNVYFKGTIEQWNNISINPTFNSDILNATIHCKDGIINQKEEN